MTTDCPFRHLLCRVALIAALLLLVSCADDRTVGGKVVESHVSLTLVPGCWTYFNIAENCVVGTAAIGDEQADAVWAERTDWDIAFSEYGLRTNGGTSGRGQGGLMALPADWDVLTGIPAEGYVSDGDSTQVFVPLPNSERPSACSKH